MLFGDGRVSSGDQTLDLQKDTLAANCGHVCTDVTSGVRAMRPGLDAVPAYVRDGDTITVRPRSPRSLLHLIDSVSGVEARGIGCRSLTEWIDTTTIGGKLIFRHGHDCHPGLQDDEPKACFGVLSADRRFHFSGTAINSYARRV
jgi:DNA invertase Pin-like site-specific DNA recombinase